MCLQGELQKEREELQRGEQRSVQDGPGSGQRAKDAGTWLVVEANAFRNSKRNSNFSFQ